MIDEMITLALWGGACLLATIEIVRAFRAKRPEPVPVKLWIRRTDR